MSASMAGFLPGPGMAVYYATKAYVLSFTEALHSELKSRGIRVTVLCPGPVPTEFAERAGVSGGLAPGILTQTAETVAEAGYRGLMRGQRVVVPGLANKLIIILIPYRPAPPAAADHRFPAAPAQVRAAHIARMIPNARVANVGGRSCG